MPCYRTGNRYPRTATEISQGLLFKELFKTVTTVNENGGTFQGDATITDGKYDAGTNGYIEYPASAQFNGFETFSIVVVTEFDSDSEDSGGWIDKTQGAVAADVAWHVGLVDSSRVRLRVSDGSTIFTLTSSTSNRLVAGALNVIVVTFNFPSTKAIIYVNSSTDFSSGTPAFNPQQLDAAKVEIGRGFSGSPMIFDKIREIGFYTSVLSDTDVQTILDKWGI